MHPLATNRYLWLIVPLVALGGIVISQSMQSAGVVFPVSVAYLPVDPGIWGNIIGSALIAGIAYIKPRRDIVSLLTPLYAVIIFLADDQIRGLFVLQAMYAITLTILAIRLREVVQREMRWMQEKIELFLASYHDRMRPIYRTLDTIAAHRIALAFLSFKHGLYEEAVQRTEQAFEALGRCVGSPAIRTALAVMRARADDLQTHGAITIPLPRFSDDERNELALPLSDGEVDDPEHLTLTNALLLIYAAGIAASPRDVQALDEQQRYIIQTLGPYKKEIEARVS